MKKILTLSLLIIATICVSGQSKDPIKKDTIRIRVPVQVPVYEHFDTIKVKTILYGTTDGHVYYINNGWVILKGFAIKDEKGKWRWTTEPVPFAALSGDKKKHIENYIQLIQ